MSVTKNSPVRPTQMPNGWLNFWPVAMIAGVLLAISALKIADCESVNTISDPFKLLAATWSCGTTAMIAMARLLVAKVRELLINCFIHPYIRGANTHLAQKDVNFIKFWI